MASLPTSGSSINQVQYREFNSGTKFRNGDTLLARITPCLENGKSAYVDCLNDDELAWGSTEFIVLRSKGTYPNPLGYLLARDPVFRSYAIRHMSGTSGRQRVQGEAIGRYPLAIAPENILLEFDRFCAPLFAKIKANHEQNQTLADLRDTLLPKLMSGEIRLRDAEKSVEDA
jgi:type I restriction enzyme S subunit